MSKLNYPKRPPFFANKFCRLMTKCALANQIGPDAAYLLMTIAMTEDAKQYRGPVTYYNGQLGALIGKNTDPALIRVRDKAVESGWLHYEPGGKSKAGLYWVLIPKEAGGLRDRPTDESPEEYGNEIVSQSDDDHHLFHNAGVMTSVEKALAEAEDKRRESVNLPTYTKKPSPKDIPAEAGGGKTAAKLKPPRTPQPTDLYFEEICSLAGDAVRHSAPGRIVGLAKAMIKAGLLPEQLRGLPAVVKQFAPFRSTCDLDTITACWPWILTPPTSTGSPAKPLFKSKAQAQEEQIARSLEDLIFTDDEATTLELL